MTASHLVQSKSKTFKPINTVKKVKAIKYIYFSFLRKKGLKFL